MDIRSGFLKDHAWTGYIRRVKGRMVLKGQEYGILKMRLVGKH
jgi:hypothetical protein